MYNLVVAETASEMYTKMEEYKSRVIPLAQDKRPEAQKLLQELLLA